MTASFVLIFELDEENEIDNQENWIKANPNIGKSIPYLDFENTIKKAGDSVRMGRNAN